MKKILSMVCAIALVSVSAFAVDPQRSFTGWGATVTASTIPASVAIEQAENTDTASNGTFASTSNWQTGTAWRVTGGVQVLLQAHRLQMKRCMRMLMLHWERHIG